MRWLRDFCRIVVPGLIPVRSGVFFDGLGRCTKKDLQALEQKRAKVARQRHIWIANRQPFMAHMLERIGFVDETRLKTNMAKTTGGAPRGQRALTTPIPYPKWPALIHRTDRMPTRGAV